MVDMFNNAWSTLKDALLSYTSSKTQPLQTDSDLNGYFPYAQKAVAKGVKFIRNDEIPYNAIHRTHPFSKKMQNTVHYSLAKPHFAYQLPFTKEHEGVHDDQYSLDDVRHSLIIFHPNDHVALHLAIEAEAYTRGNYSALVAYKRGSLSADTIKNQRFDTIPFLSLLNTVTPENVSAWDSMDKAMTSLAATDLPSEKNILAKAMLDLSGNSAWRSDNAQRGILQIAELNHIAFSISETTKKTQKKWFNDTGINELSFRQPFTEAKLENIINRDGTDYLSSITSTERTRLHQNLFQLNVDEVVLLNRNIGYMMQLPSLYRALSKNSF
jgi:hypothetical protein